MHVAVKLSGDPETQALIDEMVQETNDGLRQLHLDQNAYDPGLRNGTSRNRVLAGRVIQIVAAHSSVRQSE